MIVVGEMREPETIATALTAAETGHLVLSTLHTIDAAHGMRDSLRQGHAAPANGTRLNVCPPKSRSRRRTAGCSQAGRASCRSWRSGWRARRITTPEPQAADCQQSAARARTIDRVLVQPHFQLRSQAPQGGGISSGGICAFTVAWERPVRIAAPLPWFS